MTRSSCDYHITNKQRKSGTVVHRPLLAFLILATLVATGCASMAPTVYEGSLTERTLGPMNLEKGKQYVIFLEARIGWGTGGSETHYLRSPKSSQVVTFYDSSGSAIPLVALERIHEYWGGGKCGISVAGFQARESGVHYYEVMVDHVAWEKFTKEFGWGDHAIKGLNKIVIRQATAVKAFDLGSLLIFIAVFVGIITYVVYQIRKKRMRPD